MIEVSPALALTRLRPGWHRQLTPAQLVIIAHLRSFWPEGQCPGDAVLLDDLATAEQALTDAADALQRVRNSATLFGVGQ